MPDYSLGKIYKIVSNQTNKIYIGSSTKKRLSERMTDLDRLSNYGQMMVQKEDIFLLLKFSNILIIELF